MASISERLGAAIAGVPFVQLPEGCDQKRLMQTLLDEGISTRRGVMNSHLEEPYRDATLSLPESERAQNALILPLAPQMGVAQVDRVCDVLRAALVSQQ